MHSIGIFFLSLYVLAHALLVYYYLSVNGIYPFDDSPPKPEASVVESRENPNYKEANSVYDFTVKDINGNDVSLGKYKGQVLLIVNVASECGFTDNNYAELQELYERYGDSKGLKILAFPCDQFGNQEPGGNEEIKLFTQKKQITFDMFAKIEVNGKNSHPLWDYLKYKQGGLLADFIKWNFTKFIVDKNGQPVERHPPTTDPKELVKYLEKYW